MLGFIYLVGRDVLRWAVITAAVLVYVEIGPGGEALGGLVALMVQTLLGIEWGALTEQALAQLSVSKIPMSERYGPWPIKAHSGGCVRQLGNTEIALAMEPQSECWTTSDRSSEATLAVVERPYVLTIVSKWRQ